MFWNAGSGWEIIASESGQAMRTTSSAPLSFNFNMVPSLNEVAVSARVRFSTGSVRFMLRQSSEGDYTAQFGADGVITLHRAGQLVSSVPFSPIGNGEWHTLRISAVENIVRVSVDGIELVGMLDVSPLPPGTFTLIGAELGNDGLVVDDVAIWWYDRIRVAKNLNQMSSLNSFSSMNMNTFVLPATELITYVSTTTNAPSNLGLHSVYNGLTYAHSYSQSQPFAINTTRRPSWSPVDPLLAYECNTTFTTPSSYTTATVCIGEVNSSLQQTDVIALSGTNRMSPVWSPDGTQMAFAEVYTVNAGGSYNVAGARIYSVDVSFQNGVPQFASTPVQLLSDAGCLRENILYAVINSATLDWGADGNIYFGVNSGIGATTNNGFYRIDPDLASGGCAPVELVLGWADVASFNSANNTTYTMDARNYPIRANANGDLIFSDWGGNAMLYQPAATTTLKLASPSARSYDWSPDGTQFAFLRPYVSGGVPDDLVVNLDPFGTDDEEVIAVPANGPDGVQTRRIEWTLLPSVQLEATATATMDTTAVVLTGTAYASTATSEAAATATRTAQAGESCQITDPEMFGVGSLFLVGPVGSNILRHEGVIAPGHVPGHTVTEHIATPTYIYERAASGEVPASTAFWSVVHADLNIAENLNQNSGSIISWSLNAMNGNPYPVKSVLPLTLLDSGAITIGQTGQTYYFNNTSGYGFRLDKRTGVVKPVTNLVGVYGTIACNLSSNPNLPQIPYTIIRMFPIGS